MSERISHKSAYLPRLQRLLRVREVLQIVDVDGAPDRHDEPDLVVVEARVEVDLGRVVDVDRVVHPVDRWHVLAPHGANGGIEHELVLDNCITFGTLSKAI